MLKSLYAFWDRLSSLGINLQLDRGGEHQTEMLANRLAFLLGMVFTALLATNLVEIYHETALWNHHTYRLIVLVLICILCVLVNSRGYHYVSKYILSFAVPFFLLIYPLVFNPINQRVYFWFPYISVMTIIVPSLLFNRKATPLSYWIGIAMGGCGALFSMEVLSLAQGIEEEIFMKNWALENTITYRLAPMAVFLVAFTSLFYKDNLETIYRNRQREQADFILQQNDELSVQNEELTQQKEEITVQRDFLEEKNEQLKHITNQIQLSIQSGEVIQRAMLPTHELLTEMLQEYFVLNLPKDIVSGDFYWISKVQGHMVLVVGDCTGHGVSGALITMIAKQLLDKIIRTQKVLSPAVILEKLHEEIAGALHQREGNDKNGLDLGILVAKPEEDGYSVVFGGAKTDIYFLLPHGKEVQIVSGTRRSIGGPQYREKKFEEESFKLPWGCRVYLSTDGCKDQNNEKNQKLGKKMLFEWFIQGSNAPIAHQQNQIKQHLKDFMGKVPQRDDIMMLGWEISKI